MTKQNDREKQIDEILAQQQTARDAESRSAIHTKLIEEERRAAEAQEDAARAARYAAAFEKVRIEREKAVVRYAAAVKEFRQSYVELAALDQICGLNGFGPAPASMELRHIHATPDAADGQLSPLISGSLQQDIIKIINSRKIEG